MLTSEDLKQVKQCFLRGLPRVLEQDPGFVVFIEGIVNEKFPRRDEFARALDEFTGFKREVREQFDQVDARFDQVDTRFDQEECQKRGLRLIPDRSKR